MAALDTLILCGINPTEVIDSYYAGKFDDIVPKRPVVAPHKVEMIPQHASGSSTSQVSVDAVYDTHRSSGSGGKGVYRIYTSNHAMYAAALQESPPDIRGLRCHWCHGDLERLVTATPAAWPAMLVTRYWHRGDVHYFEGEGMYCDTRCAESHRIQLADGGPRAVHYRTASPHMRMYHALLNGGELTLVPRPHWSLLREYGGSMSREEYHGIITPLRALPHTVHLPHKYEYETKIIDA